MSDEFFCHQAVIPVQPTKQHRVSELENRQWDTAPSLLPLFGASSSRGMASLMQSHRHRRRWSRVCGVVGVELPRRVVLVSSSLLSSKLSIRLRESMASSASRSLASNAASWERLLNDLIAAEECNGLIEAALDDGPSSPGKCARRRLIVIDDRMGNVRWNPILLLCATIVRYPVEKTLFRGSGSGVE